MDKYTPDELRDLPNMKRRVMQNVLVHVTSTSKQRKRSINMKFTVLTAAFTLGICLFVAYEVFKNKETGLPEVVNNETNELDQNPIEKTIANIVNDELAVEYWKRGTTANTDIDHNANANPDKNDKDTNNLGNPDDMDENDGEGSSDIAPIDYTRPNISVSNNKFYIEGVSLGDSVEKVTSILGNNYITPEDAVGEFVMTYDNIAHFTFENNKLISVILIGVKKEHYDKFYNASPHIKIESETMNLLYIKNTEEIIKSEADSKTKLRLYLTLPGPEFYLYNPEYKH